MTLQVLYALILYQMEKVSFLINALDVIQKIIQGWYPYGAESYFLYSTCQEAQKAAYKVVSWLNKE